MFNNLILVASCFAVLWGTLFPVISEAVTGEKISVDAPFFNRINIPIGLALILLTGVGPLIAWRRSSVESLKRAFLFPTIAGVALMVVLAIFGVYEHPYALVSFGLCMFVTATIVTEFWKGASAIKAKNGIGLLPAAIELTHRNTRRYGGYLVHMGIVFMFIGYTGAAFNKDITKEVAPGHTFQLGHYNLRIANMPARRERQVRLAEAGGGCITQRNSFRHAICRAASLQIQPAADLGSVDPQAPERRFVH